MKIMITKKAQEILHKHLNKDSLGVRLTQEDRIIHAMHEFYLLGKEENEKGGWVSVEERLPEKNGIYLVHDPNSPLIEKRQFAVFKTYNKVWYEVDDKFSDSLCPDYWMTIVSLPPSPKAEKG